VAADDSKKTTSKKRRGRGEGSVYFDEARRLWVSQVSLGQDPVSGKRRRETVYGATKKEVQDKLRDLQAKAADGRLDQTDMSAKNFLELWLGHIKPNVRAGTFKRYEIVVRKHLIPHLGNRALADLTAWDVAQLYRKLEEGGVPGPTRHVAGTKLRQALRYAVRLALIHSSPADRIDVPKLKRRVVRPLDVQQVQALLVAARQDRLYAIYVLALDTGARISELLALSWEDLDEARGELRIDKSLEAGKDRRPKECKTRAGRRRVLLSAPTLAALREHRAHMAAEGHGSPIMFPLSKGGYMNQWVVLERHYYPTLARAGLPRFRFHDLRHTCATMLLGKVNIKVVSERLGHANVKITLDTYSHVMPSMQEQAAAEMGALLAPLMPFDGASLENGSKMAAKKGGAGSPAYANDCA
jgi:integrase